MLRRATPWILALPLVATSVLVGHALAYALTGAGAGDDPRVSRARTTGAPRRKPPRAYLLGPRGPEPRPVRAPLARLGMAVFVVQEHAERYAHTGQVPLLLTDRTFLVGLLLQVPVGIYACSSAAGSLSPSTLGCRPARGRCPPSSCRSSGRLAARQVVDGLRVPGREGPRASAPGLPLSCLSAASPTDDKERRSALPSADLPTRPVLAVLVAAPAVLWQGRRRRDHADRRQDHGGQGPAGRRRQAPERQEGNVVRFVVVADAGKELHLHGYDIEKS